MKKKKKKTDITTLMVKAAKKASRDEEIAKHGKSINYAKVVKSKKVYDRKKNKAGADEALPYLYSKSNELPDTNALIGA